MKLKSVISLGFFVGLALLPNSVKRWVYNTFLKAEIHPTASIGLSFVKARKLKMGPHSRIGHLNVIRNLELLQLDSHASIKNANTVGGLPLHDKKHFTEEEGRCPALIIGEYSRITGRHYFDCSHTIKIGHHTTIAGLGSAFFTHGINLEQNRQEAEALTIGNYAMIGARCVVVKGAKLPDYSALGANSTLHKAYETPYTLYSGVPAKPVKELNPASLYFHREAGYVD